MLFERFCSLAIVRGHSMGYEGRMRGDMKRLGFTQNGGRSGGDSMIRETL